MIIDGHAHACGVFLKAETLIQTLDDNGVDKVVLVPGEPDKADGYSLPNLAERFPSRDVVAITNRITKLAIGLTGMVKHIPAGNDHVQALARACPGRVLPFHWVLLSEHNGIEELECLYAEHPFYGIKIHQCWENFSICSHQFEQVAQWAETRKLPVFAHLYSYKAARELASYLLGRAGATFIIGHLFGLEEYAAAGLRGDSIYFDITMSYLVSTKRILQAIEQFGARQVVMGSDTPYGKNSLALTIEKVRNLPISDSDKELILGGNLQRLLRV